MNPPRSSDESHIPAGSPGCDHRLYSHAAQFYFDSGVLIRFTSEFVITALEAGDSAVILATNAHQLAFRDQIHRRGIDVAYYAGRGRYVELDADSALTECLCSGKADFTRFRESVSRVLERANAAATNRDPRVIVFGELVSLLWEKRDCSALLALEDVWESLSREHCFSLFCGYSIQEFAEVGTEDVFLKICAKHSTIIPADQYADAASERRIVAASARAYSA